VPLTLQPDDEAPCESQQKIVEPLAPGDPFSQMSVGSLSLGNAPLLHV
jgi:hypothetical protein